MERLVMDNEDPEGNDPDTLRYEPSISLKRRSENIKDLD
jgi:hypothetical protein